MKAAKNFIWGGDKDQNRRVFKVGEDIPKKIAEDLDDSFFLEKVKKKDLTRDQLLILAGVGATEEEDEEDELTEEGLRAGMAEISTKEQLASWAKEFFDIEVSTEQRREEMEDYIVASQFEEVDEEEAEE